MRLRTISDISNPAGKYILLRDDFNVQILDGKIADAFRIEQSLPTIRRLSDAGARVAIVSHLGRPKGRRDEKYSMAPVAAALSELLGRDIPLVSDCIGDAVARARAAMRDGDVVLLENVRFYPGEENNDGEFAAKLADGFDIFVNDAFAVSHRAHASTAGVAHVLPGYAGLLLESEIAAISGLMKNPKRPLLGIIAGAKVSDKIGVLKSLVKLCDKVVIAGGLGTTFKCALGARVGNSLYEPSAKEAALEILDIAKSAGCEVMLPIDKGVAKEAKPDAARTDKTFDAIQPDDIIFDEGEQSVAAYSAAIDGASMVVWNGPVGMAEWQPTWSRGTFALARHIAARTRAGRLESIVGGGDVVAALEATGVKDDMTYVSTGGGAFLEFIEGRALPGIAVLHE